MLLKGNMKAYQKHRAKITCDEEARQKALAVSQATSGDIVSSKHQQAILLCNLFPVLFMENIVNDHLNVTIESRQPDSFCNKRSHSLWGINGDSEGLCFDCSETIRIHLYLSDALGILKVMSDWYSSFVSSVSFMTHTNTHTQLCSVVVSALASQLKGPGFDSWTEWRWMDRLL